MGTDIVYELRSLEVRTDVAYHGDEARLFNSTMRAAADQIERLRAAPDEREAINAMACYFDTRGNLQMQAWGSLLHTLLRRMTL